MLCIRGIIPLAGGSAARKGLLQGVGRQPGPGLRVNPVIQPPISLWQKLKAWVDQLARILDVEYDWLLPVVNFPARGMHIVGVCWLPRAAPGVNDITGIWRTKNSFWT